MESKFIQPELQVLYYWHSTQEKENEIDITVQLPPVFNYKSIEVELSPEKDAITVDAPGIVPFIQGKLLDKIVDFKTEVKGNEFHLILTKENNVKWARIIDDYIPGTHDIDPHSAFEIYVQETTLDHTKIAAVHTYEENQEFAASAVTRQYVPALMFIAQSLENDEKDTKRSLVEIAAMRFQNPEAFFMLALMMIDDGDKVQGFKLLKEAASRGVGIAVSIMGQMISPLSGIDFEYKDAESALEFFEKVISQGEEPIALYEASKLYLKGVGCKKDVNKARKYYDRAKKVEPGIPEFEEEKENSFSVKKAAISAVCAVGAAALALGVMSIFRKKK